MSLEEVNEEVLLMVLEEVEEEIRIDGVSLKTKASLFFQLGAVYGLMGDRLQQEFAWQKACQLDPQNEEIKKSLASLT